MITAITLSMFFNRSGPKVIKLSFMLNSTEQEISTAHKMTWVFNVCRGYQYTKGLQIYECFFVNIPVDY